MTADAEGAIPPRPHRIQATTRLAGLDRGVPSRARSGPIYDRDRPGDRAIPSSGRRRVSGSQAGDRRDLRLGRLAARPAPTRARRRLAVPRDRGRGRYLRTTPGAMSARRDPGFGAGPSRGRCRLARQRADVFGLGHARHPARPALPGRAARPRPGGPRWSPRSRSGSPWRSTSRSSRGPYACSPLFDNPVAVTARWVDFLDLAIRAAVGPSSRRAPVGTCHVVPVGADRRWSSASSPSPGLRPGPCTPAVTWSARRWPRRSDAALSDVSGAVVATQSVTLPIAALIAILRDRLYDIDRLISRTFVYGLLTAILAGLYSALIRPLQRGLVDVTGQSSETALVLTTLILATTFTPIKKRLEEIAGSYLAPQPAATQPVGLPYTPSLPRPTSDGAQDRDHRRRRSRSTIARSPISGGPGRVQRGRNAPRRMATRSG